MTKSTTNSHQGHGTKTLPPGPGALELAVGLPSMLWNPILFCRQLISRYGGIVRLNFGFETLYLIGHPDFAEYVLRERAEHFGKGGKLWEAARPIFGNGIATSEGETWLRQRRLLQPQFTRQGLSSICSSMITAILEELEGWSQLATLPSFELASQSKSMSLNIFLHTIFNTGVTKAEREAVGRATLVLMTHLHYITWGSLLPEWITLPGAREWHEALRIIDQFVFQAIDKRRRGESKSKEQIDDILNVLIKARDEATGEGMSDRQIRDEAITMVLAGFETTATSITWSLYELCRRPEMEQKVREELDRVLGKRTPTFEDLAHLTYLKRFIMETLRFHSTAWMTHRVSTTEEEIGGFLIPARSMVVVLIDAIHHNPAVWKDPEAFRPDRFSQEESVGRPRAAFMPFSIGPHQCIGNNFALIEATLFLAMLLQRYRIKLTTQREIQPLPRMLQRPRGDVLVRIERI